jgi:minor extracellular serine protease Vpr
MLRKMMGLLLLTSMIFSMNSVRAVAHNSLKIDASFLNEVVHSEEWVPVIIELKDDPTVEFWHKKYSSNFDQDYAMLREGFHTFTQDYQNTLMAKQENFLAWSSSVGIKMVSSHHITMVLNAITAEIRASDIPLLLSHPQVFFVHDDRQEFLPLRSRMAQTTAASASWEGFSDYQIPRLSGKNKLVGIIDTGLDRNHTEFSRQRKVRGGYNFADNTADFSDPQGHGTHVAGIAAGTGTNDKNRGMAFDADLMVYRVFTPRLQGARNVIAAIDRSVSDKCDVINLSLGRATDENSIGSSAYHRSIANADTAGVFVVAAAGNDGSRRNQVPWTISSPSIVEQAFSVAALNDRRQEVILSLQEAGTTVKSVYAIHVDPTPHMTQAMLQQGIVDAGFGAANEFDNIQVTGKVVLIQRGPLDNPLTFRDKVENATRNGARGVILYNHTSGEVMTPTLLDQDRRETPAQIAHLVSTIMLTLEDGLYLKGLLDESVSYGLRYEISTVIASFSSMGPTADAAFKPEISAPGDQINSTYPTNSYANAGGTSMSSPSIAGLAILLKEAYPKWTHNQIKSAFMNTADIAMNPMNSMPISFLLQGAGSARIDKAIKTPAFVEPRALVFSQVSSNFDQTFTVTNARNDKMNMRLDSKIFLLEGEISPIDISFDLNEVSSEGFKSAEFIAGFEIRYDEFQRNRYEGLITIGNDLHVPFVISKNPVTQVDNPVSDVRISRQQLNLAEQNEGSGEVVNISFSLNAGTYTGGTYNGAPIVNSTNYGAVNISIVDEEGEVWDNIAALTNVIVGNYQIKWNGRNSLNRFFLPKGKFYVAVQMNKIEFKDGGRVSLHDYTELKEFSVIDSNIPSPVSAVFSSLRSFKEYQEFNLDLNLGNLIQQGGVESNIASLEFEMHYDASRLMYRRFVFQGFLKQYEKHVDIDIDEDDNNGKIKIKMDFHDLPLEAFRDEKSFSLVFRAIGTGRVNFSARAFRFMLENGDSIRVKPSMPSIRITNRDFLLADINNDKIVDRFDFLIFSEAYGSIAGDNNFNTNCDFNQDNKVDIWDLMILTREMGKYI